MGEVDRRVGNAAEVFRNDLWGLRGSIWNGKRLGGKRFSELEGLDLTPLRFGGRRDLILKVFPV
jgi:hypothetical protein